MIKNIVHSTYTKDPITIDTNNITYGDLNNDGKEDVAVIVYSSFYSDAVLVGKVVGETSKYSLAVFINQNDAPIFITAQDLGRRTTIHSITIQSGIISIDATLRYIVDGVQPDKRQTLRAKLSSNELVEVEP